MKKFDRHGRVAKTTELAKAWREAKTTKEKQKYSGEIVCLLEGVIKSWIYKLNVPQSEDLIQEYNLKVLIALENYNPDMAAFETYLYWHFKKARNLHDSNISVVTPPQAKESVDINYYKDGEIKTKTKKVIKRSHSNSLNVKSTNNFDNFKEDKITKIKANEDLPDDFENIILFFQKRHIINDLESDVLTKRLRDGQSFTDISAEEGLSHEAISKRFQKALRKIKPYFMVYRDRFIC